MKLLQWISIGSLAVALSGCATLFGDKNRSVLVTSTPAEAKVYYQGTYVGNTPTSITVNNPMEPNDVQVRKEGYFESTTPIKTHFQASTILNIFFWPGFIVDVLTGDIKRVEPNLNVQLNPNSAEKSALVKEKAAQ